MLQSWPLRNIAGLKWGSYVGSPDCPDPVLSWMQSHGSAVASLVALPTGEVFGLRPSSCLLVMYSKEKGEGDGGGGVNGGRNVNYCVSVIAK